MSIVHEVKIMTQKNESDAQNTATEETKESQQQQTTSTTQTETTPEEKPDSRKVKIVRVGKDVATTISYEDGSGQMKQHRFDPAKNAFEVSAIIAFAAIQSGHFKQAPESKTQSKAQSEVK
jgi:hypothetical protein